MIAVYSGDRAWRLAVEHLLRTAGVATRAASRPAELAKCLSDGRVRVVVVGPAAEDASGAAKVITSQATIHASPGDSTEDVGRRAMALP